LEDKDYRCLNAIEDELRVISQACDKMRVLKRDIQGAEERYDFYDRATLNFYNELEETWTRNGGRGHSELIVLEQKELVSKAMYDRTDFVNEAIGKIDKSIRQLEEKEEELIRERRDIHNNR